MHAYESALAAHLPWLSTLQVGSAAGLSRDVHEYIDNPDVAAPLTSRQQSCVCAFERVC